MRHHLFEMELLDGCFDVPTVLTDLQIWCRHLALEYPIILVCCGCVDEYFKMNHVIIK